jgi:hypothetical protein
LTRCDEVTDEGVRAPVPLTALTSLESLDCRWVTNEGLRAMTATVTVRKE